MLKFLNRFRFGRRRTDPPGNSSAGSNDEAKRYLNRLREEELSAGASLRRGEILARSPSQASGSAYTPYAQQRTPALSSQPQYRHPEQDTSGEDFATSFVVAEAAGSALTGYAVGGSAAGGALAGEVVSRAIDD